MKMILDKTINGNKLEEIITANFTAKEKGHDGTDRWLERTDGEQHLVYILVLYSPEFSM